MKLKNISVLSILTMWLASCVTYNNCIQVAQTQPINHDALEISENGIYRYTDDNCVITCDLWAEGGEPNFSFINKSDEVITICPEECTINLNGASNMMFTNGDPLVVAPHSLLSFSGKKLGYKQLVDCDFEVCPRAGRPSTIAFALDYSPYVYHFYLTYKKGLSNQKCAAKMDFYVSRVSNYQASDIISPYKTREIKTEYCENIPNSVSSTKKVSYRQYLFSPGTGFFVRYGVKR